MNTTQKRVLRGLSDFFYHKDMEHTKSMICSVNVIEFGDFVVVSIETHRPGLIIGKGGETIGELTEWLTDDLEKEVKIHLTESKLWNDIYS